MFLPSATFTTYVDPPISHVFSHRFAHLKASLATSDQDFATVEKKIDILWTSV
jgi:hypothetical protein